MLISQTRFCEQVLPLMMMSEVGAELDPVKTTCSFTASDNLRFRHQLFEALEELRVRRVGVQSPRASPNKFRVRRIGVWVPEGLY